MCDRVVNLPTKGSKERLVGVVKDYGYRIQLPDGLEVCIIPNASATGLGEQGVANSIAQAIEYARDRGFDQGVASVRAALGL